MYICAREGLVGEHGVKSAADSDGKGGYYGKGLLEAGTITYPTRKRGTEGQSPLKTEYREHGIDLQIGERRCVYECVAGDAGDGIAVKVPMYECRLSGERGNIYIRGREGLLGRIWR